MLTWFAWTVVLMDNHHHKTMQLPLLGVSVIVPVSSYDWSSQEVEFRMTGDKLYGDPIFYQVRGPELPASWWHRFDPRYASFKMMCEVVTG